MDRQLLLLGLLRMERMHTYQLNDLLERRLNYITDLKKSTAYYILKKLAESGDVIDQTERQGNRPERRVYEITPQGEDHFTELLAHNLGIFQPPTFADEIGVLFMHQLPADQVHAALEKKREAAQAELEKLGEHVDHGPASPVQYVIEHRRAHLRIDLEWIDRLLARSEAALTGEKPLAKTGSGRQ